MVCTDPYNTYYLILEKICEEKKWTSRTFKGLKRWLDSVITYYDANFDVLDNLGLQEFIVYNLIKIKQTEDIKLLTLQEILDNPNCLLNEEFNDILLKQPELNKIDESDKEIVLGICSKGKTIELVDQDLDFECTLQHELQHINQFYTYPSELPFSADMFKMLHEGESEYSQNLINRFKRFHPIDINDSYYIYYLVYTLLMLTIPKEMRDCWNKSNKLSFFPNIFKYITNSLKNREQYSHIFALATLIVASCNKKNTKEVFDESVSTSLNWCEKKVKGIQDIIKIRKENILESQKRYIKDIKENTNMLENPKLLQNKYLEILKEEQEFIATEKEDDKKAKLMKSLETFTFENFKDILQERINDVEEMIHKLQTKAESLQEMLGSNDYLEYQYYQFGIELNKEMQLLLSKKLSFTSLFEQLLETVGNHLIETESYMLEEKISFINEIKNHNMISTKQV